MQAPIATEPDELLRMTEVSRLLKLGRATTYSLAQSGQLPGVVRIGHSLRVHRGRLMAWIEANASAGS